MILIPSIQPRPPSKRARPADQGWELHPLQETTQSFTWPNFCGHQACRDPPGFFQAPKSLPAKRIESCHEHGYIGVNITPKILSMRRANLLIWVSQLLSVSVLS